MLVFTAARVLSLVVVCGLLMVGAPLWRRTGSGHVGMRSCSTQKSSHGSWAIVCAGVRSCVMWAQLFCSTWNFPRPGIEPVFPTLGGGFSPTVPLCIFFSKTSSSKAFNHCLNFFFFGWTYIVILDEKVPTGFNFLNWSSSLMSPCKNF